MSTPAHPDSPARLEALIGALKAKGILTEEELTELEDVASPGAGACGAQFTANTMACAFEAMGISPGGSAMPGRRGSPPNAPSRRRRSPGRHR